MIRQTTINDINSITELIQSHEGMWQSAWADDVVEGGSMIKKVLPIYWLYAGLKIPALK